MAHPSPATSWHSLRAALHRFQVKAPYRDIASQIVSVQVD
jgi:hypothetical protein